MNFKYFLFCSGILTMEAFSSCRLLPPTNYHHSSTFRNIFDAALEGDIESVKKHIENGQNPNSVDKFGYTVLHRAIQSQNKELSWYLISECNANINFEQASRRTMLHHAALYNDFKLVRYIVEHGANINAKDESEYAPLHGAVIEGNLEMVSYLVDKGANLNAITNEGESVLYKAIFSKNLALIKYLVERGLDIKGSNVNGFSVLHNAVLTGDLEIVDYLIQKGADIKSLDRRNQTVLHCSVISENANLVRYLIDLGADPWAANIYGETAVSEAKKRRNVELISFFMQFEPPIPIPTQERNTFVELLQNHTAETEQYRSLLIDEPDPKRPGSDYTKKEYNLAGCMLQGVSREYYCQRLESIFSKERLEKILFDILNCNENDG